MGGGGKRRESLASKSFNGSIPSTPCITSPPPLTAAPVFNHLYLTQIPRGYPQSLAMKHLLKPVSDMAGKWRVWRAGFR